MPRLRGIPLAVIAVALLVIGCKDEPQIFPEDSAASAGGVEFELAEYHIRHLELNEDGETIEYHDPVLAMKVDITNVGEDEFIYNPTHASSEMSQARTPVLYDIEEGSIDGAEGYEVDWDNFNPPPISAVRLEEGDWDEQHRDTVSVAPEGTISDYFLFELPESEPTELLLSIPPSMHRGELPVFIDIDYTSPESHGPRVYDVGDTIEFDDVTFTVDEITQEYIEMEDESEGDGFSNDPVLRIAYTIENTSEQAVSYDPAHGDLTGNQGPLVQSLDVDFNRARFPADSTPVGQVGSVAVEPGDSVEDFATFEPPEEPAENATFILSGSHFEQSGRVRVSFSYEPEEVEEPEQLQE